MENIVNFLKNFHPIIQALFATGFTWAVTALGAATVFMAKQASRKLLDVMLGFTGGVMIAASFWSLLAPAIEMSAGKNIPTWFPALAGFLGGGVFLRAVDRILPHLHHGYALEDAEGIKTSWRKTTLLIMAITLHNIPEGLAVGVVHETMAWLWQLADNEGIEKIFIFYFILKIPILAAKSTL